MTCFKKPLLHALLPALLLLALTACAAAPAAAEPTAAPTLAPVAEPADTKAPAESGETSAYDEAAYRAAVDALLEEYRQLTMEDLSDYDEAAHPELPWYTGIIANTDRNDLFYGFWDFDENGVPELVIAAGDETFQLPEGVYAFNGERMVYLCKEQPLGERCRLTFFSDGLFAVLGAGGAARGSIAFYRIAPNGFDTEIVDIMDYEFLDADTVTCTSRMGVLDANAFSPQDYMDGFDVPVEYKLFAPRREASAGLPNPWSEADTAEEAARGAGLDSFTPPEYLACFPNGCEGPVFRYMEGLAEAVYDDGSNRLVVRKGLGEEDVSGDYTVYPETWDIVWKGLTIHCSGGGGEIRLARWAFGGFSYSLSFNAGEEARPGLSEDGVTSLVNQIQ